MKPKLIECPEFDTEVTFFGLSTVYSAAEWHARCEDVSRWSLLRKLLWSVAHLGIWPTTLYGCSSEKD